MRKLIALCVVVLFVVGCNKSVKKEVKTEPADKVAVTASESTNKVVAPVSEPVKVVAPVVTPTNVVAAPVKATTVDK
jgi:predicted component of type VI protein secretion system